MPCVSGLFHTHTSPVLSIYYASTLPVNIRKEGSVWRVVCHRFHLNKILSYVILISVFVMFQPLVFPSLSLSYIFYRYFYILISHFPFHIIISSYLLQIFSVFLHPLGWSCDQHCDVSKTDGSEWDLWFRNCLRPGVTTIRPQSLFCIRR